MTWFTDAVDTAEDAANAMGEVASDIVETAGKAVENATLRARRVPGVGPVVAWLGALVSHVFDIVGVTIKGALDLVGGVVGGAIRMVGGLFGLNAGHARTGLYDIGSSLAGAIILVAGKAASLVQSTLLIEARERGLTEDEIRLLRRVFHDSIAYYNVRLVQGRAGLFSVTGRPFALGNTIYLQDRDIASEPDLLVHECTHVWQYQNVGARYTSDALAAQYSLPDAYDWQGEIGRGKERWVAFNKEAQAAFLQEAYRSGDIVKDGSVVAHGDGVFYDADGESSFGRFVVGPVDHTPTAEAALAVLRARASARLSGALRGQRLPMLVK